MTDNIARTDDGELASLLAALNVNGKHADLYWAGMCRACADAIARLTRERDGARSECEKQEHTLEMLRRDSTRKLEYNAKMAAECERLRALLERWRAEYGGSTFPKTGKPCNKRLDDDTDAAIDAARGEVE